MFSRKVKWEALLVVLFTETSQLPKNMWQAAWDYCSESVDKYLLINDFEFVENIEENEPDETDEKSPW